MGGKQGFRDAVAEDNEEEEEERDGESDGEEVGEDEVLQRSAPAGFAGLFCDVFGGRWEKRVGPPASTTAGGESHQKAVVTNRRRWWEWRQI